MSPEPTPPALPIKTIENIIFSEEFLNIQGNDEQIAYLINNTKLTRDQIVEVSNLTVRQRDNPAWHMIRKGRLTASNFGSVLKAKRVTPSLLKRLLGEYDLSKVKAVTWGVHNEAEAVKAFEKYTGLKVEETGIWLDSSGVLGASPDGFVGRNGVFEAKCPYTQRNSTISEAIESGNFYLSKQADGTVMLNKDHVYWHQVQGQMFLTGRMVCYFMVWTSKDFVALTIKRDESWSDNIELMKEFYCTKLFPKIIEGEL